MCGIVSYIGLNLNKDAFQGMLDNIHHRGPDEDGFVQYGDIGLGMTRLSIIDLSGGSQPIYSSDKNFTIVYNGEIYNYKKLKLELEQLGYKFKTHSDTEVFLNLYIEYREKCLDKIEGMFSVTIYDKQKNLLFVARDRLGVRPLYYWKNGNSFVFCSEIKSLKKLPQFKSELNEKLISPYLSLRYVPGPETLLKDIFKFPPGHFAFVTHKSFKIHKYWSPYNKKKNLSISYKDAQVEFNRLFEEAVQKRLVADVPVGAFLSGGLDSSAIVLAMKKFSTSPVETFSIGFDWFGDEINDATTFAKSLGCNHHTLICSGGDFKFLPDIVWHLDEPIGDPIVLPMFLLAKEAKKNVKVVLTGEGADETLAGYFPHKVLLLAHIYKSLFPKTIRKNLFENIAKITPANFLNLLFDYPAGLGEQGKKKFVSFLNIINNSPVSTHYRHLVSLFDTEDKKLLFNNPALVNQWDDHYFTSTLDELSDQHDFLDQFLSLQYYDWLPDDILNKCDKMLMAHSIEGRVPFMDHDLVAFLNSIPWHMKISLRQNKILLRKYLEMNNSSFVAKKKKKAFYLPLDHMSNKGSLNQLINDYLSEDRIKRHNLFNYAYVEKLKINQGKGEFIFDKQLFALLMLEIWLNKFLL